MIERHVSEPIELSPAVASGDYVRADLIFYGVDHSRASYEARVYVNFPGADAGTGREHPAYVGSFHVFGHGGCYGDAGHCDVPTGPRDPFDLRGPHQLTPAVKVVIATDGLKRIVASASDKSAIAITVVAVTPGEATNELLQFDELRLVTYR
jgi:tyrosinase